METDMRTFHASTMEKDGIIEDGCTLPFEGILGDTAELRIVHFLLATSSAPLKFTADDLMENLSLTDGQLNTAIVRLVPWGVISMEFSKEEQCFLYWMEPDGDYTRAFHMFNNLIIDEILRGIASEEMKEE